MDSFLELQPPSFYNTPSRPAHQIHQTIPVMLHPTTFYMVNVKRLHSKNYPRHRLNVDSTRRAGQYTRGLQHHRISSSSTNHGSHLTSTKLHGGTQSITSTTILNPLIIYTCHHTHRYIKNGGSFLIIYTPYY